MTNRLRLEAGTILPHGSGEDEGIPQAAAISLQVRPTADFGEHDFTAFALAGGSHRSPRRTIFEARFVEEGDAIVFRVTGSGFLRGMVRALVGTLLEVGLDRRTVEDVGQLADGAPRAAAGPTAPARGLVLESISYSPAVQESAAPVVD